MHLEQLELKDFRNYTSADAEFSTGLNMIIGANGQGKTNLLESIQILCGVGSHRAASASALIRHGSSGAIVRGSGQVRERKTRIDAEIRAPGGVRLRLNGSDFHAGAHGPLLPASVIFSPDDLAMIKGGPDDRRRFLDDTAGQVKPMANAQKSDFEKTLRQRNGVLKASQFSRGAKVQLEVWTAQLAGAASHVIANRLEVLHAVSAGVTLKYPLVAGNDAGVHMVYRATWAEQSIPKGRAEIEQAMIRALESSLPRDLERGITLAGPHRDDVEIQLGGVTARAFASQGEQRSLALALRLAERDVIADARNEAPILLLDDVFSELDENRRRRVAELVGRGGQSFLTTTEPEALPLRADRVMRIASGTVGAGV